MTTVTYEIRETSEGKYKAQYKVRYDGGGYGVVCPSKDTAKEAECELWREVLKNSEFDSDLCMDELDNWLDNYEVTE